MSPLLRVALLACPSAFRKRFAAQIEADLDGDSGLALLGACRNVFATGVALRYETIARDLAYAIRGLRAAPGATFVTFLTFALAIGANVAVASALFAVVLRPLPFAQPDRLVFVMQGVDARGSISFLNARDVERRSTTLSQLGLVRGDGTTVTFEGRAQHLDGALVDAHYFSVLGAHAEIGRLLGRSDPGTSSVVISDTLWRRSFGGDARALGRIVRFDGRPMTIVGVAAPDFRDPLVGRLGKGSYWIEVDPHAIVAESRLWRAFTGIARLAPGASLGAARAEAAAIVDDVARRDPTDFVGIRGALVVPLLDGIVGPSGDLLKLAYAAVVMVLAIACVNVANLTFVRLATREHELAVRAALGATRGRIAAQLTTELCVVAVAGAAAGIGAANLALSLVGAAFAQLLPRGESIALEAPVLAYAFGLVALSVAVGGLLPALLRGGDIAPSLSGAGRSGRSDLGKHLRSALVVLEVTLAVAVIVGAGLVVRSFGAIARVDVGFEPRDLTLVTLTLPYAPRYASEAGIAGFARRSLAALRAIPGVEDAASSYVPPFGSNGYPRGFTIPGLPDPHATVTTDLISDRYFRTMQIPMRAGREFTGDDATGAARVCIVSSAFAKRYFGSERVVGRRVSLVPFTTTPGIPMTVVGVAGDVRASRLSEPEPELYLPVYQVPAQLYDVIRSPDGGAVPRSRIVDAVERIDPGIAPPQFDSYETLLASDTLRARTAATLLGALAALALTLALAGVYAVTAYSVQQRTREFGIRRALGARTIDIVRDVLGSVLAQGALGTLAGSTIASLCGPSFGALLYRTSPNDPVAFAAAIAVMLGSLVLAAALPTSRAVLLAPAAAIRRE